VAAVMAAVAGAPGNEVPLKSWVCLMVDDEDRAFFPGGDFGGGESNTGGTARRLILTRECSFALQLKF
jgi:hypothetical protein